MSEPTSEQSIFLQAIALTSAAERAAYLDEACRDKPKLRAELDALLVAHDRLGGELPPTAADLSGPEAAASAGPPASSSPEAPGMVIGPYKLIEPIGEGGMGTVWMSQQTEPVKRVVALKLIKAGMDSKAVIARFEAERQALALMDHPNIAKVFDGGTTGFVVPPSGGLVEPEDRLKAELRTGRPFFVMELVKGVPITKYCDEHHLTPRQRLELFIPVCQAVQHAHQKGIIHRDLKPSNVLVALYDGKPVPKVIDFGVAKAAGQPLTEKTLVTGFGNIIGTLEYMSPEQAEINQLDIDTRSDIYSLGVLLYELLAGSPPFTRKELEKAGMLEMLRVIREQEPSKPSTKLSTAEGLPTLAANRGTEPAKLTRLVRGELDWIVMKALEKDRSRRYETANGFAMDVQRYLADEPVLACPPSMGYRLRKFARRNRGPVVATVVVALALVVGIIGTSLGLVEARHHRDVADEARQDAIKAQVAEAQRADGERKAHEAAKKRLAQVDKGNEILTSLFRDLDPMAEEKEGKPLRAILSDRLDEAIAQLDGEAVGDPLAVATLQARLSDALLGLGRIEEAMVLSLKNLETKTRLLGPDNLDTLIAQQNFAISQFTIGRSAEGLRRMEATLKHLEDKFGNVPNITLINQGHLVRAYVEIGRFSHAILLGERLLGRFETEFGSDYKHTLALRASLGSAYLHVNQYGEALRLGEVNRKLAEAKFGPNHQFTLLALEAVTSVYLRMGKISEGLWLKEEILKRSEANLGLDHPETLAVRGDLAKSYCVTGRPADGIRLGIENVKLAEARYGPGHYQAIRSQVGLGLVYQHAGKFDLALPIYVETLRLSKTKLGLTHRDTLMNMMYLAEVYRDANKAELAIPVFEETLRLMKTGLGPESPDTLHAAAGLAHTYLKLDKLDLALPLLEESVPLMKATLGHGRLAPCLSQLGYVYFRLQRFDRAVAVYEELLTIRRQLDKGKQVHPETLLALGNLATNYNLAGRKQDAVGLAEEFLAIHAKTLFPARHQGAWFITTRMASIFIEAGMPERPDLIFRKEIEAQRKHLAPDDTRLATTLAMYGNYLLGQMRAKDAEPIIRDGLKIREKMAPDHWTTYSARSLLGDALARQHKYAEAEPLLRTGYDGMKQRETTIEAAGRVNLTDAINRLVNLYEKWGKPEEADKWRAKLPATKAPGEKKGSTDM